MQFSAHFAFVAMFATATLASVERVNAVTIINGSFETGVSAGTGIGIPTGDSTSIVGWTVSSGTVDYMNTGWVAADGVRSIDLSGGGAGSISQELLGLSVGQEYSIQFSLAGNPNGPPAEKTLEVSAGGASSVYAFDIAGKSPSDMGWIALSFIFTANNTTETLVFSSLVNSVYGPALDNVSIAATPLPGALPLFGSILGSFGLFSWLRRRWRSVSAQA
jgi:choice-of-anchor C domain-containing protein